MRWKSIFELLGDVHVGVNSYHHQAIRTLSPLFEEMARSEDGLVEAISMPGKKYVAGVQWHPEYFYEADANSVIIVKSFVDSVE